MRPDLNRLGTAVRQRRYTLGLTQREASIVAKISDQTWLAVERGDKVSDRTLARVERTLGWKPGSAMAVADGGEPVETEPGRGSQDERIAVLEAELAQLRAEFENYKRNGNPQARGA